MRFKTPIAIIGDFILDVFGVTHGLQTSAEADDPSRICPRFSAEGPACEWRLHEKLMLPGGLATAARVVDQLDGRAEIYTVLGDGESPGAAEYFLGLVAESGRIKVNWVHDPHRRLNVKRRLVLPDGTTLIAMDERSPGHISRDIEDKAFAQLTGTTAPVILVADFGRGMITERLLRLVSEFAGVSGRRLIVDSKPRPLDWYERALRPQDSESRSGIHLIKPNRGELGSMVGRSLSTATKDQVDAAAWEVRERLDANVLVTLAEAGAVLYERNGQRREFSTSAPRLKSVVGAGDTCAAVTALAIAEGLPLAEACRLGLAAASVTVQKLGTEVVNYDEFMAVLAPSRQVRPVSSAVL